MNLFDKRRCASSILGTPFYFAWASLVAQRVKCPLAMRETWVRSLDREDPLEKEMATHSSTLAWKIPWTEKPGRLQSMGSQRVGHDGATKHTHACEESGSESRSVVSDSLWPPRTIQAMEFCRPEYLSGGAFPFSRGSSQSRDWTWVSCIAGSFFPGWATREDSDPLF